MEKELRWLAPGGPKAVMVIDSEEVVRAALGDRLGFDGLIEDRCAGCDAAMFLTPADLIDFHGGPGGDWPAAILCPTCWQKEAQRREEEERRHKAALLAVGKAAMAQLSIADPVDRAQAVLPGAVAELQAQGPLPPARALSVALEIARHWGLDVESLAYAAGVD